MFTANRLRRSFGREISFAGLQSARRLTRGTQCKQTPLGKQQAAFGKQMKDATCSEEVRRGVAEQGHLAAEQGAIDREQGTVVQEQELGGRTVYNNLQVSRTHCFQKHTCLQN